MSFSLVIVSCNGEIRTRAWTPNALQEALSTPDGVRGVIGYYNKGVIEIDNLTQVVDKNGSFVSSDCNPVSVQKITTVTDYDHPMEIWYNYGLLEANSFGVTFSNSVFAGINSVSTPDQGKTIANLAEAASSLAKKPAAAAPAPPPGGVVKPKPRQNCNGGPSFIRYDPLPSIP
jgi:hypothetical protein